MEKKDKSTRGREKMKGKMGNREMGEGTQIKRTPTYAVELIHMIGIHLLHPFLILAPTISFPRTSSPRSLPSLAKGKSWPDARKEQYRSSRLPGESHDSNLLAFYVRCARIYVQDESEVVRNLVIKYDGASNRFPIRKVFAARLLTFNYVI